jgi:hypothetical protein
MARTTPAQNPRGFSKYTFFSEPRLAAMGFNGILRIDAYESSDYNRIGPAATHSFHRFISHGKRSKHRASYLQSAGGARMPEK